jgi:hypothetical protein
MEAGAVDAIAFGAGHAERSLAGARGLAGASGRRLLALALVSAIACAMTVHVAITAFASGDYAAHSAVLGNNAGPALNALAHGRLWAAIDNQPTMGLSSLILRAPIVASVHALGGGDMLVYQLGAAVCLLPLALLAAWLAVRPGSAIRRLAGVVGALLLVFSPAVASAVSAGHPEDVLAAVLATVAVLAAVRGRAGWAAALLGLATGAMPWAAIAVAPVLAATPGQQRHRTAGRAAAIAAIMTLALPLADPSAFLHALRSEGHTHFVNAFSVWWPLSHPVHLPDGMLVSVRRLPLGLARTGASVVTLLPIAMLLAIQWARGLRRGGVYDALALMALLGGVRALADSTQLGYYRVAGLIPLVVWETEGLGRLPLLAAIATLKVALMPTAAAHVPPGVLNALELAWRVFVLGYLSNYAFGLTRQAPRSASTAVARATA